MMPKKIKAKSKSTNADGEADLSFQHSYDDKGRKKRTDRENGSYFAFRYDENDDGLVVAEERAEDDGDASWRAT
ncbi:MAG: hypothetical protein GY822_06935 [Deltaproteobacteria bacterium]|nr:hypothetical protein [Deltaproteobacteria bacterium]